MRAPTFILGMHRSGTTLLVKLLTDLGFFAGENWDPNAEPWYLLRRNEWILRRAGGAWDRPLSVEPFLQQETIRTALIAQLEADHTRRFTEFVKAGRNAPQLTGAWGAKDPRLSFTLSIWRELFPDCRILLVRRNGIDVAKSLASRGNAALQRGNTPVIIKPLKNRLKATWHPFEFLPHWSMPTRCFDLTTGFDLWEEYVAAAEATFDAFDGDKLAIRYEDLLADPRSVLGPVVDFCGIEASASALEEATNQIDPSRRLAFMDDATAREFHAKVADTHWMRTLGYDRLSE